MIVRQLVVLLLLAGGLTACDHSSPHTDARAAPPYTAAEVRRAFAQAGISLFRTEPGPGSGVSALFQSDSGVLVAVYPTSGHRLIVTFKDDQKSFTGRRNVFVSYPKRSPLRPKVRRALASLHQGTR
jgi:hypothetical protein